MYITEKETICRHGHTINKNQTHNGKTTCYQCEQNKYKNLSYYNILLISDTHTMKEWDFTENNKNHIYAHDLTKGSVQYAHFKCQQGHKYKYRINNKTYKKAICPRCYKNPMRSKAEIELAEYIEQYIEEIKLEHNNIKNINKINVECSYKPNFLQRMEIDIFIHGLNIGIEYNGEYWHSEKAKPGITQRDNKKKELCKQNNVKLIVVKERDWKESKEKIKAKITKKIRKAIQKTKK